MREQKLRQNTGQSNYNFDANELIYEWSLYYYKNYYNEWHLCWIRISNRAGSIGCLGSSTLIKDLGQFIIVHGGHLAMH